MPITPEALAALRGIANSIITDDLKTEVTIQLRSRAAENDYGSSAETWTNAGTYLAWVREMKATDLQEFASVAGQVSEYEVRLPIEAVVDQGDRMIILGDVYVVQNTNNLDTLPIFMKATVRRLS